MTEWRSRRSRAIGVKPKNSRPPLPVLAEVGNAATKSAKAQTIPAVEQCDQGDGTNGAGGATPQSRARTRSLDELLRLSGLRPETRLTLTELAVIIGSQTGRRPSSSTCWRWALKGVRGKQLVVSRIGGTLYTTWASVEAFLTDQPSMTSVDQQPLASGAARKTVAGQMADERRRREREAAKCHLDAVCLPRRRKPR